MMLKRAKSFLCRDEAGTATIEFVILFPIFMTLLLSAFEVGMFMTRQVLLERGVDLAVRDLRLGLMVNPTPASLKTAVCEYAGPLAGCASTISIELRPISKETWVLPTAIVQCIDRNEEINPDLTFDTGTENELMLVRACMVIDPVFATSAIVAQMPKDESGGYQIYSSSIFVNEPNT
ncbi:TadE/TadG family type IV pilus assembly protein [Candidatus Halocynthiibacter alkanivorans]|uniref:TadE/TadG family type IV pilus assembly protein n=1 Tax=Candidatus Halocynthiibacter alkanivorans TaxID=2267619 RepID=UPI000DF1397C|nr:TadE/TadG family type IV pilus assembly protein [Candidatus Halocynthiibacter alkanivorans]